MWEILAVAFTTVLAVISPGADFAMVTRNSVLHGRRAGLMTAAGIAAAVQVHVLYSMLGVALLLRSSPGWLWLVQLVGAAYLVHVGWKTCSSRADVYAPAGATALAPWRAFKTGFLTNALNPKTTLFVVSIYAQVVGPDTPVAVQAGYGLFMSLAHAVWFGVVARFLSHERVRARLLRRQGALNTVVGAVLMALGAALAWGPLAG